MVQRSRSRGRSRISRYARGAFSAAKGAKKIYDRFKSKSQNSTKMSYKRKRSSTTFTKNRKKKQEPMIQSLGGITFSSAKLTYKKSKAFRLLKQLSQPTNYWFTAPFENATTVGQSYLTLNVFAGAQVPTLAAMYQTANVDTIAGGPIIGAITTPDADDQGRTLWVNNVNCTYYIKNCNMGLCEITIYDLISKVTNVTYSDPGTDWSTGMTATQGNNTVAFTQPGISPTMSKTFNTNWKIFNKRRIVLAQNGYHKHNVNFSVNRGVDYEYFAAHQQIRGITSTTFLVFKSLPLTGSTGITVNSALVGLPIVKITIGGEMKYNYRLGIPTNRIVKAINNYTAIPANLYEFNEGSGLIVNAVTGVVSAAADTFHE